LKDLLPQFPHIGVGVGERWRGQQYAQSACDTEDIPPNESAVKKSDFHFHSSFDGNLNKKGKIFQVSPSALNRRAHGFACSGPLA
jgi:hypothetical protein